MTHCVFLTNNNVQFVFAREVIRQYAKLRFKDEDV